MVVDILFEGWANVEDLLRAELPVFAIVGLGVDANHAYKGGNWSGIII